MPHRDDQDAGVTARDVSADDAIAVAVINWELNGKKGRPSRAVRAALDSAGLVVVPVHSVYENLPFGQTWHDCEGCGMRFVADDDQDHLWAFEGVPVRCPHCYDAARQPEGDDGE